MQGPRHPAKGFTCCLLCVSPLWLGKQPLSCLQRRKVKLEWSRDPYAPSRGLWVLVLVPFHLGPLERTLVKSTGQGMAPGLGAVSCQGHTERGIREDIGVEDTVTPKTVL